MASPSSIFDSSDVGRALLSREITRIGEAMSFKHTESLFGEGKPIEGTSSLPSPIALSTGLVITFFGVHCGVIIALIQLNGDDQKHGR